MPSEDQPAHVLGLDFGLAGASSAHFRAVVDKVAEVHAALELLEDAPTELVLLRRCADVCKVTHLLRAAGLRVADDKQQRFDDLVGRTLRRTRGGGVDAAAQDKAATAVADGGLGLRRAHDLAEPAFVASRVEARPFVLDLFAGLESVSAGAAACTSAYDADWHAALATLRNALPVTSSAQVDGIIAAGIEEAGLRAAMAYGHIRRVVQRPQDTAEAHLIAPAGAEDPEARDDGSLQRALCQVVDSAALDHLMECLEADEDYDGVLRLRELWDPETDYR